MARSADGLTLREAPTADFEPALNAALGRVIRRWRRRYGFSAYEVAMGAKIARQTLTDVETGDGWFSVVMARRICDAMGLRFLEACAVAEGVSVCFPEKKRPL